MPRPVSLTPPKLTAYQFINFMLFDSKSFNTRTIITHPYPSEKWGFDDKKFASTHFSSPGLVAADRMAPVAAMTDDTFERFIGELGLDISDVPIHTKNDLAVAVASMNPDDEENWVEPLDDASPEQMQTFLLHRHSPKICVHWGRLADLYNESAPDQQEAIHQFFEKCLNRSLQDLYDMTGPEDLPEHLQKTLESKDIDGWNYVLSDISNTWVRDDLAANLFSVHGYRGKKAEPDYVIAFASTLEEAVAYATRYALNMEAKDTKERIAINHLWKEIGSAKILSSTPRPQFDHILPVRLSWEIENAVPMIPHHRFESVLMDVEKKMGVSWSKVKKLEDDLGL